MDNSVILYAWDDTNKVYRKLVCNADGKLIIDPSEIFENPPTDGEEGKGASSNWSYDHEQAFLAHKDRHDPEDGADPLDTDTPVQVGEANAKGSSHSLARADHVHQKHHAKYTDAEAVSAMGAKADNNPLNHDKYTLEAHASNHENGGSDEIDVTGLSGELADNQPPKAHKASHQDGGSDEISIAGLDGEPTELTTHKAATTGVHGVGTGEVVGTDLTQTLSNKTLDGGSGDIEINTTGANAGLIIESTQDGTAGARIAARQDSASPASGDRVGRYQFVGRNDNNQFVIYGEIQTVIVDPTDTSEDAEFRFWLYDAGGNNLAMRLYGDGVLDVDASSGLAAATVGEYDKHDDALLLKQGISEKIFEKLEQIGVMKRKDTGSGWMLNVQAMLYLLAGGIYQNRAKIDAINERLARMETLLLEGGR